MKKKLILSGAILLIFISSVVIYSCSKRQDSIAQSSAELTVPSNLLEAAKTYQAQQTLAGKTTLSINSQNKNVLQPDWKSATLQKISNNKYFIIVPGPPVTDTVGSPSGVMRKFVFGSDGTAITGGVIMELFGKSDYMAKHKNDVLENYNANKPSDFTGAVVFYDLNYKYIISQVLKDGKNVNATASVKFDLGQHTTGKQLPTSAKVLSAMEDCTDYYWVTDYPDGTETWEFIGQYCEGGGGSEMGGGGNQSNPKPPPNSVAGDTGPGDHSLTGTLPGTNAPTQTGNLCVFTTMSNVTTFFGNTVNPGTFLLAYCQQYNVSVTDVVTNGVSSANLTAFTSEYFNESATTDIVGSIDAGNPVIGTLYSGTHEVFITGYNNNGTYQYFDPADSQYHSIAPGEFTNTIKITGSK